MVSALPDFLFKSSLKKNGILENHKVVKAIEIITNSYKYYLFSFLSKKNSFFRNKIKLPYPFSVFKVEILNMITQIQNDNRIETVTEYMYIDNQQIKTFFLSGIQFENILKII